MSEIGFVGANVPDTPTVRHLRQGAHWSVMAVLVRAVGHRSAFSLDDSHAG